MPSGDGKPSYPQQLPKALQYIPICQMKFRTGKPLHTFFSSPLPPVPDQNAAVQPQAACFTGDPVITSPNITKPHPTLTYCLTVLLRQQLLG